jgi:sec-independent protein translocase protein TatA
MVARCSAAGYPALFEQRFQALAKEGIVAEGYPEMGVFQPWHFIIILVIVLVIFGPGKLPLLGKAMGDSFRDFKKAVGAGEPAEAELGPGMRRCPDCHKATPIADRFCGGCGARADVTAA